MEQTLIVVEARATERKAREGMDLLVRRRRSILVLSLQQPSPRLVLESRKEKSSRPTGSCQQVEDDLGALRLTKSVHGRARRRLYLFITGLDQHEHETDSNKNKTKGQRISIGARALRKDAQPIASVVRRRCRRGSGGWQRPVFGCIMHIHVQHPPSEPRHPSILQIHKFNSSQSKRAFVYHLFRRRCPLARLGLLVRRPQSRLHSGDSESRALQFNGCPCSRDDRSIIDSWTLELQEDQRLGCLWSGLWLINDGRWDSAARKTRLISPPPPKFRTSPLHLRPSPMSPPFPPLSPLIQYQRVLTSVKIPELKTRETFQA
jgi:hypothetical protein